MLEKFVIEGGRPLKGTVKVSGSKNAALPILAATLLADGKCVLKGVPRLEDIKTMCQIISELGVSVERMPNGDMVTEVVYDKPCMASYDLVRKMRASVCVLGPLLGRRGRAKVSQPGGCVIGVRPIDLHLKGFSVLGAKIKTEHGYVVAHARRLRGASMFLGGTFGSTVTGTANVLMAATLAQGTTVIENAACEPEVQDLAEFLVKMGADISGIGTHKLVVKGVNRLHGAEHTVIPDRIEAGTYMIAAAITKGRLVIDNCRVDHLSAVIDKLKSVGVKISAKGRSCRVWADGRPGPADITTLPYPGFPTDMQAQFMALQAVSNGISVVTERIYPDRFMHVAELLRMGADIRKEGPNAIIHGVARLSGAPVMASDLRASAALVLAGLAAEGRTELRRIYHIDRGYDRIEEKLNPAGARIRRMPDDKDGKSDGGD
jgi:UDP-N-acetylglucosamine 1-carboxyvinyltransferase